MGVPITTGWDTSTGKDTRKTIIRSVFDNTAGKALVEWKQICKAVPVEDEFEREMRVAGLGSMQSVAQGQNVPLDTPKFGSTKDYTQGKWGNGFRITEAMKQWNKIKLMSSLTANLRKTMDEGKDIEVAKMWNNPTATTYAAGFDGFALGYASHTTLSDAGTTYSNLLSAGLSNASLQDACEYFDTLTNDQGQTFTHAPRKLVVAPQLRFTAGQLLKSENEAGEISNTINLFPDWDLKAFVYHRFSSATAWALIGDIEDDMYGPRVYTYSEPKVTVRDAYDRTGDTEVYASQYFTYGFTHPILVLVGNV